MRYARGRRLTEAARALAAGADNILTVALDAGYGSHEAFTRAFGQQFGTNPEEVRARASLEGLALIDAIRRLDPVEAGIESPRIEPGRVLLIAGLLERYAVDAGSRIPFQWQRFTPYIGHVPDQTDPACAYGVMTNGDTEGNFDYISGVEILTFSETPSELARLRIAARPYAVFTHREHISQIPKTWNAIWNAYLPSSHLTVADAPYFERYDDRFDPHTGTGITEIWIPLV
jgi:AraC family transcriptional regulator